MPIVTRVARLVLVDDHDEVRSSFRDMLVDEPSVEVVGEACDGRQAVSLCTRVRPDLVLMDLRMPEMDGIAATRAIRRARPNTSVLVVTMYADPDYLLEALKAGAAGYVLKECSRDQLISAVLRVLSGDTPLDPDIAARLLKRLARVVQGPAEAHPEPKYAAKLPQPLTPRELEVLELVALGLTNRQIAEEFVVSTGTVKNHVEHIIGKLEASDRTQAVVRALELGIITFPEQ